MKKIAIITTIILVVTSCSEFLVQEPDSQVSIDEQFSTLEGMHQSVNGMYYNIETLISGKHFIYADLIGGNLTFTPDENDLNLKIPTGLDIEEAYEFRDRPSESNFEGVYDEVYEIINQANLIIERIEETDFLSEEEKNQIVAESLTARALAHYIASLFYAQNFNYSADALHTGIVYNTRTLIAGVDYPSRETIKKTWELLQNDLDRALSLYTTQQVLSFGSEYSYFNPVTTHALYARIALQMNDWQKAFEHAEIVINHSGVALMSGENYISEWEKPEEPVSEIILEFSARRTSEGEVSSSVANDFFAFDSDKNYNDFVASGDLIDLYSSDDIRTDMFLAVELPTAINEVVSDKTYYFTKKFQDDPGTTCIRLSEMYLICAEAKARLNDTEAALTNLNTIRERAGLTPLFEAENLLDEIFLERRRELAFEGHLLFDIIRFKKDINRQQGCLSSVCNLSYPSNYFILPIPESSINLNENMQQNEGY